MRAACGCALVLASFKREFIFLLPITDYRLLMTDQ